MKGAVHGGQSYEQLEGRGTLYTPGSRRKLPYGYGGLDESGGSPYFEKLFDVKHLLIRIGRNQNVITRVEVLTGTIGTNKKCWRIIEQELVLPISITASI